MAQLTQIWIYPIKSLDGLAVSNTPILPGGALQFDRQWALVDPQGNFVNAKRHASIHRLRAQFDLTEPQHPTVQLGIDHLDQATTFDLHPDNPDLLAFFSDYFGFPIRMQLDRHQGFPDDRQSPGPTLISTATLATVAHWFDLTTAECRQRFRANLELDSPAFWEDRLFGPEGHPIPFQLGDIEILGINPCLRCIVPTRHPQTGEPIAQFPKTFSDRRRSELPPWAEASRFQNPYRLSVNTRIPATQAGKVMRVGDELVLPC